LNLQNTASIQPRSEPDRADVCQLKALLRKAAARSKLGDTIDLLLDAFSPAECADHFRHSGYGQPTWEML